jgi:hypothetical protein
MAIETMVDAGYCFFPAIAELYDTQAAPFFA